MANNLFVSYDLHTPGQNYQTVIEEIQKLGEWAKVHYSLWYIRSNFTAAQAKEKVKAVMDKNDKLMVIDANSASWNNLDAEVSQYILDHWTAPSVVDRYIAQTYGRR